MLISFNFSNLDTISGIETVIFCDATVDTLGVEVEVRGRLVRRLDAESVPELVSITFVVSAFADITFSFCELIRIPSNKSIDFFTLFLSHKNVSFLRHFSLFSYWSFPTGNIYEESLNL